MQQQVTACAAVPVRRLLAALLLGGLLAGCKSTSLAPERARAELERTLFSPPRGVQTAEFVSGAVSGRPYALSQFLYAKHWLDCTETSPGAFSSAAVCTLNAEGRTYGAASGWTLTPAPQPKCERCTNVRVPLARAALKTVDRIDAPDKTHAVVAYTYAVVPNEFGGQLADWMSTHPIAWCGPQPAASGGWNADRAGRASFVYRDGRWQLAQPAPGDGFDSVFAPSEAPAPKPCAT